MRIFILTMDEPVYTGPFIREIISKLQDEIVGLAITSGDRLTVSRTRSRTVYALTLLVITGVIPFLRAGLKTFHYRLCVKFSRLFKCKVTCSLSSFAEEMKIPVWYVHNPNDKDFLARLEQIKPDIIINQSQSLLKKNLLDIPRIGVINRHNALLPKNRGRLSPFWTLFKNEPRAGVSIHYVEEDLDSGNIICQVSFPIERKDNFNTILRKCYTQAPDAMLKAIEKLRNKDYTVILNDDSRASYNSIPTFHEALIYRRRLFLKIIRV